MSFEINDTIEVGYEIPALYVSPTFTFDLLSRYKKVTHLTILLNNDISRLTRQDTIPGYAYIVQQSTYRHTLSANLSIRYGNDQTGEISPDLYNLEFVERDDAFNIFKESLQGVSDNFNFCLYSYIGTVQFEGYQINGKLKGNYKISGD